MYSEKRATLLWLKDMLSACQEAIGFAEGLTFQSFCGDAKTLKAILFNLQIIGEAANKLPQEWKVLAPEIPWQQLRGLRNRVAHEYFDMNLEMVWTIVQKHLPPLLISLREFIKQVQQNS